MSSIVVSGYAQRIFYPGGIEYRNYAADFVGNQSAAGDSVFTSNNFIVTTNLDPKASIVYQTSKFSNFFTQDNLSIDQTIQELTTGDVTLNPDPSKLDSYAYFGSLKEFVRVSLENIITNWPASLYVTNIQPVDGSTTGDTVLNYSYDSITNVSTFQVDTDFLLNNYNINFLESGSIIANYDTTNPLRNLTTSFAEFVIDNDLGTFPVIGYTGATTPLGDVLTFEVEGNAFTGGTSLVEVFHIRPNDVQKEKFFKSLNNFENYILNRQVLPVYTAEFSYPVRTDVGVLLYQSESLTWPTSDAYNLDFNTQAYVDYATRLSEISDTFDANKTDLIHRFLTAESISSFDTPETEEEVGMKVTKLLRIMGRNYDDVKLLIDGTAFGNNITYNKKENVPDELVKTLARSMGWVTTQSLLDNDVVEYFLKPSDSSYSGISVGMTTAESEIELWRRLLINSPWLFKSKGTRKAIEFLLGFIGTPNGLIEFKEYIYKADRPVDVDLIAEIYEELNLTIDPSGVWFDSDGYPRTVRNTPDMYFQKGGLWYRQTAGSNATVYVSEGNNPHIGPYDGGKEYLSNFTCLVPDFEPLTITKEVITSGETKLYVNYNDGRVNDCDQLCQEILTIDSTLNGTLLPVETGDTNSVYGNGGARFYSPLNDNQTPVTLSTDALGQPMVIEQSVANPLWGNGSSSNGRLNNIGVWNSSIDDKDWIGFTKCIELVSGGTYTIGIAADNRCRFSINGDLIVNLNQTVTATFNYWHVYQVELMAGTNIIEMEGWNSSSDASFGAEIYSATTADLSGMTTEGELSAVTVFTTGDLIGVDNFTLGDTNGYSCPAGFALNTCDVGTGGTPTCSKIEMVPCPNPIPLDDNYFRILMPDNSDGAQCYETTLTKIDDPCPTVELTDCGCPVDGCDDAIKIDITRKEDAFVTGDTINACEFQSFELLGTGEVEFTYGDGTTTTSPTAECCTALGFISDPSPYYDGVRSHTEYNSANPENVLLNGLIWQDYPADASGNARVVLFGGDLQAHIYFTSSFDWNGVILNNDVNPDEVALNNWLTGLGVNLVIPEGACRWNGGTTTVLDPLSPTARVIPLQSGGYGLIVGVEGGQLDYNVEVLNASDDSLTTYYWVITEPYGTPSSPTSLGNPNTGAPVPIVTGTYRVRVTDGDGTIAYVEGVVVP